MGEVLSVRRRKDRQGYLIDFTYEYPDGRKVRISRKGPAYEPARREGRVAPALGRAVKDGTYNIHAAGEETPRRFSDEFIRKAMLDKQASTKAGYRTFTTSTSTSGFGPKRLSDITKDASIRSAPT